MGLTPSQVNSAEPAQWQQAVRQALDDARCATPAFLVEDMDISGTQTVSVQIAIQERVRTPTKGAQWWDIPPIIYVPVILPRGGGYSITLPLKKGDQGLLVFCDTCFDNWWKHGQTNAPPAQNTPPLPGPSPSGSQRQLEVRRHHVHDCGFIPGMSSQNNLVSNYSTDSMQIRSDDGTSIIDVSEAGVVITGPVVSLSNGLGSTMSTESGGFAIQGASVSVDSGGTPLPLMTQAWQIWFTTYVLPHITTGIIPAQPGATTVLKGQ